MSDDKVQHNFALKNRVCKLSAVVTQLKQGPPLKGTASARMYTRGKRSVRVELLLNMTLRTRYSSICIGTWVCIWYEYVDEHMNGTGDEEFVDTTHSTPAILCRESNRIPTNGYDSTLESKTAELSVQQLREERVIDSCLHLRMSVFCNEPPTYPIFHYVSAPCVCIASNWPKCKLMGGGPCGSSLDFPRIIDWLMCFILSLHRFITLHRNFHQWEC